MLSIKPGAKIEGLQAEMIVGLLVVKDILTRYGLETVITEGTGGVHKDYSLHYKGLALDIRSKHVLNAGLKGQILMEIKIALNDEFDFILENEGSPAEHFHLEVDPK